MLSTLRNIISNRIFIFVYSIFLALISINQYDFPFAGLSLVGISIVIFTLISKSKITWLDYLFAFCALISSANFFFKTSWLVLFLSFCVFVFANSFLIYKENKTKIAGIIQLFVPFLFAFLEVWNTKDTIPAATVGKSKFYSPSFKLLTNILLTLVILAIIIPLLSYSNIYFGQFVQSIWDNIYVFLKDIFTPWFVIKLLVFTYFYFWLPKLFCYCSKEYSVEAEILKVEEAKVSDSDSSLQIKKTELVESDFSLTLPKSVVAITLFAFFVAQIQTYFYPNLLKTTNGNIVNEVFFHLSVVCLVVFILIFVNLRHNLVARILSAVLVLQSAFLTFIAFNSDWSYITSWGLTHKRLYGFLIIAAIIGVVLAFGYDLIRTKELKNLTRNFAAIVCLFFAIGNSINFDYIIYRNPPKESAGIEQDYIRAMNLDSYSLAKEFESQKSIFSFDSDKEFLNPDCGNFNWYRVNNDQINFLKSKYSNLQILSFNWNEYQNYISIKDFEFLNPDTLFNFVNSHSDKSFSYLSQKQKITPANCYIRSNNKL